MLKRLQVSASIEGAEKKIEAADVLLLPSVGLFDARMARFDTSCLIGVPKLQGVGVRDTDAWPLTRHADTG
jgi:imidazoleglycerol phosphate synthase glutamine amidotransferase subunit HisH